MVGEILLLTGAVLALFSSLCIARFDDILLRMHALAKASTTGLLLAATGAALMLTDANDITTLLLAAALNLLTTPVAANLLSRATYRSQGIATRLEGADLHAGRVNVEPSEAD